MRQSAIEHAQQLFHWYHIDPVEQRVLEVGGTKLVWLEISHHSKPAKWLSAWYRLLRNFNLQPCPKVYRVVVRDNPLLTIFPQIELLDLGFNADVLDTTVDMRADFLSSAYVAGLENRYGLVLSFDTLEHVADPFTFCRHLVQVARPGGYIYLATVFSWEHHPSPKDYWRFSPDGLRECFSGTSARILQCDWHIMGTSVFSLLQKI